MFKDLNEFPQSDDWFPYKYIDAEVKKRVYKTKGRLAGYGIEKETKHYVEYFNHNHNCLNTINIEIDKSLIDHE